MNILPALISASRWLSGLFEGLADALEVEHLRRVPYAPAKVVLPPAIMLGRALDAQVAAWASVGGRDALYQFPHCDERILHAPGECEFCDRHADWQCARVAFGVNFTGQTIRTHPCPADQARPPDSPADHRKWGGNRASMGGWVR